MKIDANKINASLQVLLGELIKIESITGLQLNDLKKELQEKIDGYSKVINSEKSNVEMKGNKRPHHDLIVEWAKDTSKIVQLKIYGSWCDTRMPDWIADREYRIKPREFIKGHWYPCYETEDRVFIKKFNGVGFFSSSDCTSIMFREDEYLKIGESLGEIKLGGDAESERAFDCEHSPTFNCKSILDTNLYNLNEGPITTTPDNRKIIFPS